MDMATSAIVFGFLRFDCPHKVFVRKMAVPRRMIELQSSVLEPKPYDLGCGRMPE